MAIVLGFWVVRRICLARIIIIWNKSVDSTFIVQQPTRPPALPVELGSLVGFPSSGFAWMTTERSPMKVAEFLSSEITESEMSTLILPPEAFTFPRSPACLKLSDFKSLLYNIIIYNYVAPETCVSRIERYLFHILQHTILSLYINTVYHILISIYYNLNYFVIKNRNVSKTC